MTEILEKQASEKRELPKGWQWTKLGKICTAVRGVNFRSGEESNTFFEGAVACVTTSGVQNEVAWNTRRFINKEQVKSESQILRQGDILVSTANSKNLVGKSCLIRTLPFECTFGAFVTVVRPSDLAEGAYIALWMRSQEFMAEAYEKSSNTTGISNLRVNEMLDFQIPLPPLETQKRIAALLDEQMAALARARKAAEEGLEGAHQLKLSYLREIFECDNSSNWEQVKLGDLLAKPIRTGLSKSGQEDSKFYCLTLSAVRNGSLDLQARKAVGVSSKEAERNLIKLGAFYVVRGNGNKSLVGRGGLAPESKEKNILYPDLLFEVNPNPNQINANYLRWVWDSPSVRTEIESRAKTSAGIYKINTADLESISIKLPPLKIQGEISETLRRQIDSAEKLVKSLQGQLALLEVMPSAILRGAFSGEL